jgi:hypothetical protein
LFVVYERNGDRELRESSCSSFLLQAEKSESQEGLFFLLIFLQTKEEKESFLQKIATEKRRKGPSLAVIRETKPEKEYRSCCP